MIAVRLILDHVPAYCRSLIQRDIHQIGNLRSARRLDNVFPNIVIDVIRTGYNSRPIESTDIDSTCTDRVVLVRLAISDGVRLTNEELRARLSRRQTVIFHRRGCNSPARISPPIGPRPRCSYRCLRVKRIYRSANSPRVEITAICVNGILVIARNERNSGSSIAGLTQHCSNRNSLRCSSIRARSERAVCYLNACRGRRNIPLFPLSSQREIAIHYNLIARLIGLSVVSQIVHEIVVDCGENILSNRSRRVRRVGFVHQGIHRIANCRGTTVLVGVLLRIRRIVGFVHQTIVCFRHGHHGNGRNLVASATIGAGDFRRTGFYACHFAIFHGSNLRIV